MNKKFSPKFLRQFVVLFLFFNFFFTFSQTVTISLEVSWAQWSTENRVELYSPNNVKLLTIEDSRGYGVSGTSTSFSGTFAPTPASIPADDNVPANSGYYVILYDAYGDDWNGTSFLNITVDGQTALTFNGDFTTNASANTEITQREYFAVESADDASFSYAKTTFCQSETDPTPTITGESGGTFSSTSGLSINSSTGAIDVSASSTGNYVVTYTTANPGQNSSTQNITIFDSSSVSMSYPFSFATQDDQDLTPTLVGSGGTFSSTSGLSINSSTGVIDVSASTPGFYTVSYTLSGGCSAVYTDDIQIVAPTYYSSRKYIEYIPGTMPVIISAPHGGVLTGSELPTRSPSSCGTGEMDDNTDILIREIQKKCFEQFGVYPYVIINNLRRNKLDPNRAKNLATCGNSTAGLYFDAYHGYIDQASADITAKYGKGLYIDLHGQSHTIPRVEVGYNLSNNSLNENLNNSSTNADELEMVTIKNLITENIQNLTFEDLIRGSESFGGLLQTTGGAEYDALGHAGCSRSVGYRAVPSHIGTGSSGGSCDDTRPGGNAYFAGDYYSNIRHGSGDVSHANTIFPGNSSLNGGGGTIDGIMTEVNRRVRDLGSAYSSVYGRTDTRSSTVPFFSRDYAQVIEEFIDLHYNDFSNFSYANNTYDVSGTNPTPSITGKTGGTFSASSGLSINSSTGEINLSTSTAGNYTVSYVAPNISSHYKKEFAITITDLNPVNRFTTNSGNWSNVNNWSKNSIPTASDNILIPSGNTLIVDIDNAVAKNVSVEGTLQVNSGNLLTVTGSLTNTGTIEVNSSATSSGSLITQGSINGEISYNRFIKQTGNWYMISSPVSNQDIDEFVTNNPLEVGGSGNVGLSNYNNVNRVWEFYQAGSSGTGNFTLGLGRAVRVSSASNVTFTGDASASNVSIPLSYGNDGWNLIGNPYPSFINANQPSNINNFITENFALLDSGYKAIYFWDSASNSYKPYNNSSSSTYISPGQGFFVKISANGSISFNKNLQSHQTGDLFYKSNNNTSLEVKLNISDGTLTKSTKINYVRGATSGLDEGLDAALFGESDPNLDVFTNLVSEENNLEYALQALPTLNYENLIIPVGVNAKAKTRLHFNANIQNLPKGIHIYLEDKETNTFTKLDENSTGYSVLISEDIFGKGRFYLHAQNPSVLSASTVLKENEVINVFTKKGQLIINGLSETANVTLYSVIGKELFSKVLSNKTNHQINITKIPLGIYFVKIKTANQEINKKVVIE